MSEQPVTTDLRGTGIGRGVAVGPVLRMPDPLPEPEDTASTLTPDAEKERARASLAAIRRALEHLGPGKTASAPDRVAALTRSGFGRCRAREKNWGARHPAC